MFLSCINKSDDDVDDDEGGGADPLDPPPRFATENSALI